MDAGKMTREDVLDYWEGQVTAQRSSGMKVADWCAASDVSYWQFQYWRRVLGREGRFVGRRGRRPSVGVPRQSGFQQIVVDSAVTSASPVEVVLPSGVRIRVEPGVDRAVLRIVLEEAARC
jgi:hypothetical protein